MAQLLSVVSKQFSRTVIPSLHEPLPSITAAMGGIRFDINNITSYNKVCGYGENVSEMPLLYPAMICSNIQGQVMTHKDFPFALMGLVHLANKVEQFKHILTDETISINAHLDRELILHEKGFCINVICEIHSENSGDMVWRSKSTLFKFDKKASKTGKNDATRTNNEKQPNIYSSSIKQEDVENAVEVERWALAGNLGRKYAAVSGDWNPIHIAAPLAYMFGFRHGAIAHGMWTKARTLASLMPAMHSLSPAVRNGPLGDASSGDLSEIPMAEAFVEFKTPLFLPSTVALRSTSKELGAQQTSELAKHVRVFEVRGTTGDNPPYMRGRCSWLR